MNYNPQDYNRRDRHNYQPHRSERYRNPEQSNRYSFDDYGDAAHGGYGNESYRGTFGNQGNKMGGSRHVANRGMSTYDTSRNYGNMGSYGGAQGFGSSLGGYSSQRTSHPGSQFDSGHGNRYGGDTRYNTDQRHGHGYQSDYDSHGQNSDHYSYERGEHDLYGNYAPRRFQGSGQSSYDFDRNNYRSHSFGGDRGNYMGSGYERTPRRNEYGATRGDYGTAGKYMSNRTSGSYSDEPYGMSGYYRGGYGFDSDYDSYARDRDERNNDW